MGPLSPVQKRLSRPRSTEDLRAGLGGGDVVVTDVLGRACFKKEPTNWKRP